MKNKKIILVLGIFIIITLSLFVSADIFSFNSGGSDGLIINPDLFIENFFFSFNRIPVIANVLLLSTSGNNYTSDNLTLSFSGYDLDRDYITNITDWRVNGNSLTLLNLPFDKKITSNSTRAIRDYSTYENNGTLGGGISNSMPNWNSSCKIGGCYTFDGSDDYLKVNHNTSLTNVSSMTVSAWINAREWETNYWEGVIVAKNDWASTSNGYVLRTGANGRLSFVIGYGANWKESLTTSLMSVGTWYHVVGVFNGTALITYINGIERNVDIFSTLTISPSTYDLNIGRCNYDSSNRKFNGSIDEVKIFNRALSPEQIKIIYNEESLGYQMKTLSSYETGKGEVWQVGVTPNDYLSDGITVLSNNLTVQNIIPNNPSNVNLRSLNLRNESNTDLNCSAYISDGDDSSLTAYINWTKNGVYQFTNTYSNKANNTFISGLLGEGNTTLGEVWSCSVRTYDGTSYSNWVSSNNLTIVDITNPNITILSPLSNSVYNYTTLDVDFNISISENENVSQCLYSLEGAANVTMAEVNDSYFWFNPTLGPGPQTVEFYCNDTSGNWGYNSTRFEILNEAAIAIDLSDELLGTVQWNVVSLPIDNLDAVGNNGTGVTLYWINISVTSTTADLYVKADGDLFNDALDVLKLGNETFSYAKNEATVNTSNITTMSTNYILIGNNLVDGDVIYMKFFLDAPVSQAAGTYLNNLEFKAVRDGQSP